MSIEGAEFFDERDKQAADEAKEREPAMVP